jgi:hypothetical protein
MYCPILIAHAEGEETLAEQLAEPIRAAGYDVAHRGTVMIGDSVIAEAARILGMNGPVVLCGTVRAMGTRWARRVVNAARQYSGVRVFIIQMEQDADVESVSFDDTIARYWENPNKAIQSLIGSLQKYYPISAPNLGPHYFGDEKSFKKFQQLTALYNFDLTNVMKVIGHAIEISAVDTKLLWFGMPIYFLDPVISCICDRLKLHLSLYYGVQIYNSPILLGTEIDKSFQQILLDLKIACLAEIQEGHFIVKAQIKSEKHLSHLFSEIKTLAENEKGNKVIVIMAVDESIKLPPEIVVLPIPDVTIFDFHEWAVHHLDKRGWSKTHDLAVLWKELFQEECCFDGVYQLNHVYRHLDWVLNKLQLEQTEDEFEQKVRKQIELARKIRRQVYG